MTRQLGWNSIPLQLRQWRNWCYTRPDSVPSELKAPRGKGGFLASVIDPSHWMSFEEACREAAAVGGEIGFVLQAGKNLTCIDLDVKDVTTHPNNPELWTSQKDYDRYWKVCQAFNSYTEISAGGKGLHIWLKGEIGRGHRRDGIEVYSQERFIICTGKIVINSDILAKPEMLSSMVTDMIAVENAKRANLVEYEEEFSDKQIIEMASNAVNGSKFNELCAATSCTVKDGGKVHGSYLQLGYPSQSEADLALMSMLAFYSRSNEQCKRLFRKSGLGQRDKALKDDRYLNETLRRIRSQQLQDAGVDVSGILAQADKIVQNKSFLLHVPNGHEPVKTAAPPSVSVAQIAPVSAVVAENTQPPIGPPGSVARAVNPAQAVLNETIRWPPGLAGEIAKYVYSSAPRPVREVAIVVAIGLLAGICGKCFSIPGSGLNMYINLVARSAVGKEAMHSGMSTLINAISRRQPAAFRFVDFNEYVSGPALKKAALENPSFVNVSGEWGQRLGRMASERDPGMATLRTVMTDLYQKSGPQSIVGGLAYSDKDKSVASVSGVAYSMIGESTPKKFFSSLTENMMEDGFLSRFLIVEYTGLRPPLNKHPATDVPAVLADALADLCTYSLTLISKMEFVAVDRTDMVSHELEKYEQHADMQINMTKDEAFRQMWNRASLKVMRLSALLAVADNWLNPIIDMVHLEWAMYMVNRDIKAMEERLRSGGIGNDDRSRMMLVASVLRGLYTDRSSAAFHVPRSMLKDGVVPRSYIQAKTMSSVAFSGAGPGRSLDDTLRTMCDNGYIYEMDRSTLHTLYGTRGKAYKVVTLPDDKVIEDYD